MKNKVPIYLLSVAAMFNLQISVADDFLDQLNSAAESNYGSKINNKEKSITQKTSTSKNSFIPKNKNKENYDIYLKDNFPETYLKYIKLNDRKQSFIYTKYAKKSFPRIEETQEIIKRFLKK